VHDDVLAYLRPFAEVLRRFAKGGVITRTFAETVEDLTAGVDNAGDAPVTSGEVIARCKGRVGIPAGENLAHVGGAAEVMGADTGNAEIPVLLGEICAILHVVDGEGAAVDFGIGGDGAAGLGAVNIDGESVF